MDIGNLLKAHDVFRSFSPKQVDAFTAFCSAKTLDEGDVVYGTDKLATHTFVLLDGQVHLHLPGAPGNAGIVVSRVQKGELFGIAPLLGCERYTTRAVCAAPSKILYIEARPLMEMLKDNGQVGQDIMRSVARGYFDRYRQLADRIQRVVTELSADL